MLKAARSEAASAAACIERMKGAQDFEVYEREWRNFLNHLEKVWVKTERGCQEIRNQFQPWQGQYSAVRKKDPLLQYLKQARDADNHSIQDITKVEPGGWGARFVNPQGGYIKNMVVVGGMITHYEGDPMIVEAFAGKVTAVRVKNNGSWFNVPASHLGDAIRSNDPVALAQRGLAYYSAFLDEAEKKFFRAG